MTGRGNHGGALWQQYRSLQLTDKGIAATDRLLDDDTNPFGLVRPRCIRCWRPLGLCPGHGNATLPAGPR